MELRVIEKPNFVKAMCPVALVIGAPLVLQTGQPLKLSCKVQGSPEIHITWLKDGSEIVASDRNIMSFDGSVAALEIPSCCVEDSGEFVCLAINESGRDQCSSSVAIKGLYFIFKVLVLDRPSQCEGPIHITGVAEDRCTLSCSDGRNHSLSIMTDQQEDEGEYTCKAINDAGEAETKGVLVLEAASSFHPDYPLKETYYAGLGTTLRVHAVYIGRPEPKIMWLHGAKTLENTDDISIETTEYYTHLVIKNVQRRVHGGKYRIRLHNHFGRADTAFNVEIYGMLYTLIFITLR
uniref:Ig-like domain-containing protein n=1 Tax=Oryzias latipes TaxID=8090 RepID=A0A3P9JVZ1_ORYLA